MYNCRACKKPTEPKQVMLCLIEYREVPFEPESLRIIRQIKREIPVCSACYEEHKDKQVFTF
jgi:hypothetical protein